MSLAEVPRRFRVVLADDAVEIRMLVRLGLQLDGRFEVVAEAGDGAAAVRACEKHHPDIAVLDLAMPVMDGLEALPMIRTASPSTRVVVLSAFSSNQMAAEARRAGADAYLEKGAATEELVRVISGLVGLAPAPVRRLLRAPEEASVSPIASRTIAPAPTQPVRTTYDDAVAAAVDDILEVVRHELQTPLVLAEGFARLLGEAIDAGDAATAYERLEDLLRNVALSRRLLRVLADVQDIDDRAAFDLERIDVTELVHRLAPDFGAIAANQKVVVAAPQRVAVKAEENRLIEVLMNLVTNAAKFSPGGTTIEVTVVSVRGYAEIAVRDEGSGVPVGDEERVFSRFGRLVRDRGMPGLGLGLHLSRRIARAFGGDLVLQRPEGEGSRFVLRVPLDFPSFND